MTDVEHPPRPGGPATRTTRDEASLLEPVRRACSTREVPVGNPDHPAPHHVVHAAGAASTSLVTTGRRQFVASSAGSGVHDVPEQHLAEAADGPGRRPRKALGG